MIDQPKKELLDAYIHESTHVIIKLGTNTLTPHIQKSDLSFFDDLAREIVALKQKGKKVLLVSSGAVGLGRRLLAIHKPGFSLTKTVSVAEKQALASLGQSLLIDIYREAFAREGIPAAQVLVTRNDFKNRSHYYNLRETLKQLLEWGAIPVINENDAVAVEELRLGDNDTLSASIAGMYPAALLVLLTSIDGFYLNKEKLRFIDNITLEIDHAAGEPEEGGVGGMKTKLVAARRIMNSGQAMLIASGKQVSSLNRIIVEKSDGTWFFNAEPRISAKRRWLLHNKYVSGDITIDSGAERAIHKKGASLLLVGITGCRGSFSEGEVIEIKNAEGKTIARGISNLGSHIYSDAITQKRSKAGIEAIHRDNMVFIAET